jgi:hypothetical protein
VSKTFASTLSIVERARMDRLSNAKKTPLQKGRPDYD